MSEKSFNITLNSSNCSPYSLPYRFTVNFPAGSFTIPDNSIISLSQATIPYSFRNVGNGFGSNLFTYTIISSAGTNLPYPVILNDGFYTIDDLNDALHAVMYANGHYWYNSTTPPVGRTIIYPMSLSYNTVLYTTQITTYTIPTSANIVATFGSNFIASATWAGGYPIGGNTCTQLNLLSTATFTTTTLGNILGFVGSNYPSSVVTANPIKTVINGDSLNLLPPFPAEGSFVNGIVVRCNLCENSINPPPNDILTTIPINSKYGSNINYINPNPHNYVKCKSGKFLQLVVELYDQSMRPLYLLDPNVLITINIKFP